MRPFFIYKYSRIDARKKDEFIEMFEKDGAKWEELYKSDVVSHHKDSSNTPGHLYNHLLEEKTNRIIRHTMRVRRSIYHGERMRNYSNLMEEEMNKSYDHIPRDMSMENNNASLNKERHTKDQGQKEYLLRDGRIGMVVEDLQ